MHTLVHVRQLPLLHILTYDNGGPGTVDYPGYIRMFGTQYVVCRMDVWIVQHMFPWTVVYQHIFGTHCTAAEKRHMSLKRLQT